MEVKFLFDNYDTDTRKETERGFREFIREYNRYTFHHFLEKLPNELLPADQEFYLLRNMVYQEGKRYIEAFYRLLDDFGYNSSLDIIEAMRILSQCNSKKQLKNAIEYITMSPTFKEIKKDGNKITITTNDETYSFESIKNYYKDNKDISSFIEVNDLTNLCHQASWGMLPYTEKCKLVTSLIPFYFGGHIFHSYLEDEDKVIDPANYSVMDSQTFEKLYNPFAPVKTTKDNAVKNYVEARKEIGKFAEELSEPLVIALYNYGKGM